MNGIKSKKGNYSSYGNLFYSQADLYFPNNLEELKTILHYCKKNNQKITPAGTFHSFDRQNSGSEVVISLKQFTSVEFDSDHHRIKVGAGVDWGTIVEVAYQNGCMPFTCITCSKPSAAGTLSVHSYSMWTPGVGKEGNHCVEFELLTTDGQVLICSREKNSDLFYGVISGFGMLGFIISITYQLIYIGPHFELQISTTDYDDIDHLEKRLDLRKAPQFKSYKDVRSQSTLFYVDRGQAKFSVYNRQYKIVEKRRRDSTFQLYQAILANGMIRLFPSLVNTILNKDAHRPVEKKWLLKGLRSIKQGTFWAEPDYYWTTYCSTFFRPLGYKSHLYQMTHFIPTGEEKITQFIKNVYTLLKKYHLKFCMFDIMYIPQDEPFILSTSRYTDGFHVNTTFMDYVDKTTVFNFFAHLNEMADQMGGKVYLAKNCFIQPDLLEKMHHSEIEEFVKVKKQYDPNFLITSNFFETHFPSYFPPKKG